jgi:uncharacterized membrane protein YfhO
MTKSRRVEQLEDQLRRTTLLVNQVCQQNFQLLRQKTADFYRGLDSTKQKYEAQIMEHEEQLTLEKHRCEQLIQSRVSVLEEKYSQSRQKEAELARKLKEAVLSKEGNEKEVKMLRDKAKDEA